MWKFVIVKSMCCLKYHDDIEFKFLLWIFLTIFSSLFIGLGLHIDEFSRKKLDLTAEELSEEKALAYSCLS